MTTLRQRMIDAMVLRGFRPRSQVSYLRAVAQMARHHHRSPERIAASFQLLAAETTRMANQHPGSKSIDG
jgi:hypothetical protein